MALFKIFKGNEANLLSNRPKAQEGFCYFCQDTGKFYIDVAGDGTSTNAVIGTNRVPINSAYADLAATSGRVPFGTCNTAATTPVKVINTVGLLNELLINNSTLLPKSGTMLMVYFGTANESTSSSFKIPGVGSENGTAIEIYYSGSPTDDSLYKSWNAGSLRLFVFMTNDDTNGTNPRWVMLDNNQNAEYANRARTADLDTFTDNGIVRFHDSDGDPEFASSDIIIDNNDNMTIPGNLTVNGVINDGKIATNDYCINQEIAANQATAPIYFKLDSNKLNTISSNLSNMRFYGILKVNRWNQVNYGYIPFSFRYNANSGVETNNRFKPVYYDDEYNLLDELTVYYSSKTDVYVKVKLKSAAANYTVFYLAINISTATNKHITSDNLVIDSTHTVPTAENVTYYSETGINQSILLTSDISNAFGNNSSSSLNFGDNITIPQLTVNLQGKITAISDTMITLPSSDNVDEKVKLTEKTDDAEYKLLTTATTSPISENAAEAGYDTNITLNPSTNTITADYLKGIAKHSSAAHYQNAAMQDTGYIKVKINKKTAWMMAFTLRTYANYNYTDYVISGYNYSTNQWYQQKAIILDSTLSSAQTVIFGHDEDATNNYNTLWVAIPRKYYIGADIFNVTVGYGTNSIKETDIPKIFTIVYEEELTGVIEETVTPLRPWHRGEIVTGANTDKSLKLLIKSGTTEGTSQYTFNGSTAKTLDIKQGTGITLTAAAGNMTIANAGVTGIKGNNETDYRTGEVNLTPTNILGTSTASSYWQGDNTWARKRIFYGTCSVTGATAEKAVTCPEYDTLTVGDIIVVTFSALNSAGAASLTLKVNTTEAKPIKYMYNNAINNIPSAGYLLALTYIFHYDGTNWVIDNMHYNTNSTYTAASETPLAVATTADVGTSAKYAREDHVHNISLATGDNAGQVKIAGTNVSINGWSDKADLNSPEFTGTPTAPTASAGTNTTLLATTEFVTSAIAGILGPMIFKGTAGTGGTVTTSSIATAAAANKGYTYKVITDGTYGGTAAKVGDLLISDGSSWVLVPSGDEPSGTVTLVAASGSNGITISGSPITSSGTLSIGLNLSTAINGLGEGTSAALRDDYIIALYAGGGTTTTTYHRRKLSNIFKALNSSDITTALGYTPYNATNPNGYTTNTGTVTSITLKAGNGIALDTDNTAITTSGTRTISHADTSSLASITATDRTYIKSVTLDDYGHVTGLSTGTETVTNTDEKVTLTITSTSANYRVLLSGTADNTTRTEGVRKDEDFYYNPSSNNLTLKSLNTIKYYNISSYAGGDTYIGWIRFASMNLNDSNHFGNTIMDVFIDRGYNSPSPEDYAVRVTVGWTGTNIILLGGKAGSLIITKFRVVKDNTNHKVYFEYYVKTTASTRNTTTIKIVEYFGKDLTTLSEVDTNEDSVYSNIYSIDLTDNKIVGNLAGNADSATVADKLSNTSQIGDTNKPVYFTANGVPAAISYTIDKSVPSTAVFTDTATAADNIFDGSNSGTLITYAPYTELQLNKLSFDTSSTAPSRTDRLNLNGYLYATKLYSGGSEVLTSHAPQKYHTSGSWSGFTYTATAVNSAEELAFTIPTGTTSTTVAVGNHTHTTSLATDTGTSAVTLAHGGKYKLTAGGTSVIFTMPTDDNTDTKVMLTKKTDSVEYKILTTVSDSPDSGSAAEAAYSDDITINPSVKTVTSPTYKVTSNATITYNSTNGCLEIIV